MVGWGESKQLPHRATRNLLGLQIWNSMRSLDFLLSLPEVDASRVGIAGFSGGATQSLYLAALDQRLSACALVAQVSAHFFGGCPCERPTPGASQHTFRTNNVEIAALAAPKPLLLISTGEDWTRNTPFVEYPFLLHVYRLLGKGEKVKNVHLSQEGHDLGPSKRLALYRFLGSQLQPRRQLLRSEGRECRRRN